MYISLNWSYVSYGTYESAKQISIARTNQTVDIEIREVCLFELVSGELHLKRSSILEGLIYQSDLFHHSITEFSRIVVGLVFEKYCRGCSSITGGCILGGQIQGNHVHENEPSPTSCVNLFERCVNAIDVVGNLFPFHLAVREKGIIS